VPHLSESILIGVERWRFVEGGFKKFLNFVNRRLRLDRQGVSAPDGNPGRHCPRGPASAMAAGRRAKRPRS
jgi:hypothetical protein